MSFPYTIHKNTLPAHALTEAIDVLRQLIIQRMQSHFQKHTLNPDNEIGNRLYQNLIKAGVDRQFPQGLTSDEVVILILSLVPHIEPDFFEFIMSEYLPQGGDFPLFGGVKGSHHRGLLPTGETAQFILAGNTLEKRLQVQELFRESGSLYRQSILWLESVREGEPLMSGRIILAQEWIDKMVFNTDYAPRFGMDFPARRITTDMDWDDVVLHPRTRQQIEQISTWLAYQHLLAGDENLKRKIKPGYRVLLYGPPGTGKTLTATLLGKQFGKDVYRIDLSQVVSKFIGETEKTWKMYSTVPKAATGSCSLMRLMPHLASIPMCRVRMINMPIRR